MENALQQFQTSLQYAQKVGITALLADLRQTIPTPLGALDRIAYFQRAIETYQLWFQHTGLEIKLAILQHAELYNSYTPGVDFARNYGLDCSIFNSEKEALFWLRNANPADRQPKVPG